MADLTRNAVDVLPAGMLVEQLAGGRPLRVKLGIDPTTADIHLGHTVVLEKLREFQQAGHTVVLIVGDFTARVGDPSGRSTQRPLPSAEEIAANAATYQEQAFKVLDRERTEVRFNSEWLRMEPEALLGLLSQTTVARLLERDDFQRRMAAGVPIAALELLYPLLQGYDSVAVEADVELGGTDQKFNLLFGRDVQAAYGQKSQSILTMPILVGIEGARKMSKSLGNYVGVTDPPEEMFGRLMRVPDKTMPDYFQLLLGEALPAGRPPNEAKRELARRIVERFHDAGAAPAAEQHFDRLFVQRQAPDEIEEIELTPYLGEDGGLVHIPLLIAAAFEISSSEARRLIKQGGVKLDGEALPTGSLDLEPAELDGRVLQVGKRRFR
ncbi:MAG: tyrosine--tRNA ligase, partial [Solirubrobacterales bacterium]|nr:tyrosine--tRNA ligase [Solirubrobacterales bacterium]